MIKRFAQNLFSHSKSEPNLSRRFSKNFSSEAILQQSIKAPKNIIKSPLLKLLLPIGFIYTYQSYSSPIETAGQKLDPQIERLKDEIEIVIEEQGENNYDA